MRWLIRPRIFAGMLLTLIGLYALIGFFLFPFIIKAYLIPAVAERIKHPIVVREVALNPFTLSLRINGLEVSEIDHTPILGMEELFINLSGTSLFLQMVGFDEIRLDMPYVSAKMNREGKLNLLGLVPPPDETAAPPPVVSTARESQKPIQLEIRLLKIDRGILEFRDESKRQAMAMDIVPIDIALRNFSTVLGGENAYSFKAEIGKGEALAWEGTIALGPLVSDGKLSLSGVKVRTLYQAVQDRFSFDVQNGELSASGVYHIDAQERTPRMTVKDGVVSIRGLAIGERGGTESVVEIPVLDIEGIQFDLAKQVVSAAKVHSADARFDTWIDPDGGLNYQFLFTPIEDKGGTRNKALSSTSGNETAAQPWSVGIGEIGLRNYRATFEDRSLARPGHVEVDALNLSVKDVQMPFKHPLPVEFSMKLNKTGSVGARGQIAVDPMTADLELALRQIAIRPFQPYFDRFLNVDVRDGAIDLSGMLHYAKVHPKGPLLRFQGDVSVNQLSITDRTEFEDVVAWKSLAVQRLNLDVEPTAVKIGDIAWVEPAVQMVVEADGRVNVSHLLASSPTGEQPPVKQEGKDRNPAAKPAPVSVMIDQVKLVKAAARFRDLSIEPGVKTEIRDLSGTIKGLSSKQIAKADVALTGKVGSGAPIKVSGRINPLSENAYTDLDIKFDNLDLTVASPYAGKFAGYPIVGGKLFLDLKYKIAMKELVGENKVLIDQLTFGDKTDSRDATSLPVPLAVALLKDRNGQIDVDLPVRGDLNDPDFKYGRVVWNAVLNLLGKAATSPLSLLGGLVGGDGDNLKFIEFSPGRRDVSDVQAKKMVTMEKVLVERPGLFLEIEGVADPKKDRLILSEGAFKRRLWEMKQLKEGRPENSDGEEPPLAGGEEDKLIDEWYAEVFPVSPQTATPVSNQPPTLAEKRAHLLETVRVPDATIRALGQERAANIRDRLLENGSVAEDRVVLRDVQLAESSGPMVNTRLTVAGRKEPVESTLSLSVPAP